MIVCAALFSIWVYLMGVPKTGHRGLKLGYWTSGERDLGPGYVSLPVGQLPSTALASEPEQETMTVD